VQVGLAANSKELSELQTKYTEVSARLAVLEELLAERKN
jgi:hypothetical protein